MGELIPRWKHLEYPKWLWIEGRNNGEYNEIHSKKFFITYYIVDFNVIIYFQYV